MHLSIWKTINFEKWLGIQISFFIFFLFFPNPILHFKKIERIANLPMNPIQLKVFLFFFIHLFILSELHNRELNKTAQFMDGQKQFY